MPADPPPADSSPAGSSAPGSPPAEPTADARGTAAAYDPVAAAAVITAALLLVGGADLVLGSLGTVPGVVRTPARKGVFRSTPQREQIGEWRYEMSGDGRLTAAHVVGGIVLAELTLSPQAAGTSVAQALAQHIRDLGAQIIPAVEAVLEGLGVAAGT